MRRRHALGALAALPLAGAFAARAARAEVKVERVVAKIGKNHGHELVVKPADVIAASPKTYDLSGTSGHAHEVTLGADDFKKLKDGGVLRMPSTRYDGHGHLHRLLVKVAPAVDPPESVSACEVVISGQDDHELVVSAVDIATGADKTFDMQGIAPHAHAVTLTTSHFADLKAGKQIKVRSTADDGDGHSHLVFVKQAAAQP